MIRQAGVFSMAALTVFLLCGATAPEQCNTSNERIGPSTGEVVGVGVAAVGVIVVGTVVLVHVHHAHHTVKGCVYAGPRGFEVKTDDNKVYALSGDTLKVKQGDLVKFHGNKIKRAKSSTDDQTFMVEKMNKDYGPCKLPTPTAATPATAASL